MSRYTENNCVSGFAWAEVTTNPWKYKTKYFFSSNLNNPLSLRCLRVTFSAIMRSTILCFSNFAYGLGE